MNLIILYKTLLFSRDGVVDIQEGGICVDAGCSEIQKSIPGWRILYVEKRKFEKVLISRTCEDVELHGLQEFSENVFSDELTNLVSHKK